MWNAAHISSIPMTCHSKSAPMEKTPSFSMPPRLRHPLNNGPPLSTLRKQGEKTDSNIKPASFLIATWIPVDTAVHQYDHPYSQPNPPPFDRHLLRSYPPGASLHSQSFFLAPVTLPLHEENHRMFPGKVNVYLLSPLCYRYPVHRSHSSLLCFFSAHI